MFELAICFFFPIVSLAAFIGMSERKNRSWFSLALLTFGILFVCVLSEFALVQTVVLSIALVMTPDTWSRRKRVIVFATLTLIVLSFYLIPGFRVLALRHQLRQEYPIESLSQRLTFEPETIADPQSAFSLAYADGSDIEPQVLQRLNLTERENRSYDLRRYELHSLHDGEVRAFTEAAGLGIGRMIPAFGVRRENLSPMNLEPLSPLPSEDSESFVALDGQTIRTTDSAVEDDANGGAAELSVEPLARRVYRSTDAFKFVPDVTLGYVAGKQQAAGFLSHRFARNPEPVEPDARGHRWEIVRLELVSLLKFKEARVYVSKELPQIEKLQHVPTRSLDDFEREALAKLWRDDDVVFHEDGPVIHMLGALRAATECLDCHSVKRGQLLGAFSYELRRRK